MNRPEKLSLAHLPTPIRKLNIISSDLNKEIYIKRDDLTGSLLSGNKIRKLEYELKKAVDLKADTVVTCGGLQSNHVRATVVAARRLGIKPIAVLRGEKPEVFDGNTLIIQIMGAEIVYVTVEEYSNIDTIYSELSRELKGRGLKPYFIPEGASTPLGSWGYIEAMEEVKDQQLELGIDFDSIFFAIGSGGTHAGLLLGKYMSGLKASIEGINVYKESRDFSQLIHGIITQTIEEFDIDINYNEKEINIHNDYIGLGYARATTEEFQKIADFALKEGIILDHVYTGKAFIGMADLIRQKPGGFGKNILFMHTGGMFGIYPEREMISGLFS